MTEVRMPRELYDLVMQEVRSTAWAGSTQGSAQAGTLKVVNIWACRHCGGRWSQDETEGHDYDCLYRRLLECEALRKVNENIENTG